MNKKAPTCDCNIIHRDKIENVKKNFPNDKCINNAANFFKAFGDTTRIKIIYILFQSEMCVCDLAELLDMSQSAVSHQLKKLRDANIVKFRRDGKVIYYSLDDNHIHHIMAEGFNHVCHT